MSKLRKEEKKEKKKRKKKKKREIEVLDEVLPQKTQLGGNISKPHQNQLKIHIRSIGIDIESYVKFWFILILIS